MALDIMNNSRYQSWEDYDTDFDTLSEGESSLINNDFENELSIEEIDEKIKNSVKYVNYPSFYKQKIPTPINTTINNLPTSLNGINYTTLKSICNKDIEVKKNVVKDVQKASPRPSYLNWVKKQDDNIETIIKEKEEENSDSDDDDYFVKCMNKNKSISNCVPNKSNTQKSKINFHEEKIPLDTPNDSWIQINTKNKNKNIKPVVDNNPQKTRMCKIKNCSNGKNCLYAHSFEELNIKNCLFNDRCKNIEIKRGIFTNKPGTNICNFIHRDETKSNYKFRLGYSKVLVEQSESPNKSLERSDVFDILSNKFKIQDELKFTKLCKYFKDKQDCPHQKSCRFAHSIDQLRISNCLFNDKCRLVKHSDGYLVNISKTKICEHLHEGKETLENYYKRIKVFQTNLDKNLYLKKISL